MEVDTSLRDEIMTLIEPCADSTEKPPFTQGQLTVMALLVQGKPLTSRQIIDWLVVTFPHYRELVCAAFRNPHRRWPERYGDAADQIRGSDTFGKAHEAELSSYDLPITEHKCKGKSFTVTTPAARIYLNDLLGTKPRDIFRFLDLPAELRIRIYNMVLQYPPSGLRFRYYNHRRLEGHRSIRVLNREFSSNFSTIPWLDDIDAEDSLGVHQLSTSLNLLSVNKQMFVEAVHCLYSINVFFSSSATDLGTMLLNLAPSRREHLTHLAFNYEPFPGRGRLELFEVLATLQNLRKLDFRMDESRWFRRRKSPRGHYFTAPTTPGIEILAGIGTRVDVQLTGNCPTIAGHLKARVEELKQLGDLTSKKRKQPARTTKAKKRRST